MIKFLSFALLVIVQACLANANANANANGGVLVSNDALILSPKIFVFSDATLAKHLEDSPTILHDTVIASLSWTDNTGDKRAKIEITNITYNENKNSMIFETKQWLPYTLSGEVVSLPIVLKNARIKLLQ